MKWRQLHLKWAAIGLTWLGEPGACSFTEPAAAAHTECNFNIISVLRSTQVHQVAIRQRCDSDSGQQHVAQRFFPRHRSPRRKTTSISSHFCKAANLPSPWHLRCCSKCGRHSVISWPIKPSKLLESALLNGRRVEPRRTALAPPKLTFNDFDPPHAPLLGAGAVVCLSTLEQAHSQQWTLIRRVCRLYGAIMILRFDPGSMDHSSATLRRSQVRWWR